MKLVASRIFIVMAALLLAWMAIVPIAFIFPDSDGHDRDEALLAQCQDTPRCDTSEPARIVAANDAALAEVMAWYLQGILVLVVIAAVTCGLMWLQGSDRARPGPFNADDAWNNVGFIFCSCLVLGGLILMATQESPEWSQEHVDAARNDWQVCEWTPPCDKMEAQARYETIRAKHGAEERVLDKAGGLGATVMVVGALGAWYLIGKNDTASEAHEATL